MIYDKDHCKRLIAAGEEVIPFYGHTEPSKTAYMSNFYPSPFKIRGILYATSEHFFMAQKALLFKDNEMFAAIIESNEPGEAKKYGRKVKNYHDGFWSACRLAAMNMALLHKFREHRSLREKLLATGNSVLVEASPYDGVWGVKMYSNDPDIGDPDKWKGQNLLGTSLMQVREVLRSENND